MMTSRERVLRVLNHEAPDRVAVDFGGHRSSGISAVAYAKLKKALGISSGDIYVYDMVQQLAIVELPVLEALGIDVIEMGRGFMKGEHFWKDWVLPDGTPCRVPHYANLEQRGQDWFMLADDGTDLGVQKQGCLYFEQIYFPLEQRPIEDDDFEDLETQLGRTVWATPAPGAHLPMDAHGLAELKTGAERLRLSTDRAIVGLFGGNLFETPQMLYRMDNYLTYMGLYPEAVERLSSALCDIYLTNLEKWLDAVGDSIDVVLLGDDLGGQNGPLISVDMYRRFYKPFHTKMCQRVKKLADVTIMLHCCGSIEPFLNDLIEAGIEAINPVQISCCGMDSHMLKARYGDRLTLWGGGCDTHRVLTFGTPADVTEHVKSQVKILAPNGGFVFQQVHNIQANVPTENILAMFKAIHS